MYQIDPINPSHNAENTSFAVQINGQCITLDAPVSLAALIARQPVDLKQVAIEHNREIIPKSQLDSIFLAEGDAIEIVEFIGGG